MKKISLSVAALFATASMSFGSAAVADQPDQPSGIDLLTAALQQAIQAKVAAGAASPAELQASIEASLQQVLSQGPLDCPVFKSAVARVGKATVSPPAAVKAVGTTRDAVALACQAQNPAALGGGGRAFGSGPRPDAGGGGGGGAVYVPEP